ncbi:MAG: hypothetical protein ACJAVE_001942 [Polaribacter sp.]|jgi:hypothetical protein
MNFSDLKNKYRGQGQDNIGNLYKYYASRKADTLVDAMAAAIGVSALAANGAINLDSITPAMEEAFKSSFPNKAIADLADMNTEQLQGVISNWKGKLFEINVRDKLNHGDIVGDVSLGEGQFAELAESLNQPGWDLRIFNADGSVADFLQLKATNSMSYINEALTKYPDIDILATSEVAELSENLLNSNISNDELTAPLINILDSNESVVDFILPGLPFLIIAASEGRKVFVKKTDLDSAVSNIGSRATKTGLAMGMGWLAFDFTGIGWLGLGTSALARLWFGYLERDEKIIKIIPIVANKKEELLLLKASYE